MLALRNSGAPTRLEPANLSTVKLRIVSPEFKVESGALCSIAQRGRFLDRGGFVLAWE
jgi:hypothetical protein